MSKEEIQQKSKQQEALNLEPISKLMKGISKGKFVITGELEPERTGDLGALFEEAKKIEPYIDAANITDNPGSFIRVDSLASSILIQQNTNIEPIFQLTCRDRNRLGLASALLGASAAGIKNVLLLTGDHTSLGDVKEAKPVFDYDSLQLLKLAREMVDEQRVLGKKIKGSKENPLQFHIGVGANPNSSHPEIELAKVKRKIDMGAEFIQTQVIFDLDRSRWFLEELKKFGIPVLVGIFPMKNYSTAYWFNKLVPGVDISAEIIENFKKVKEMDISKEEKREKYDQINIDLFAPLISELKKEKLCSGLHITAVEYSRIFPKIITI